MMVAFLAFIAEALVGVGFYLMSRIIENLVSGVDPQLQHLHPIYEGYVLSSAFVLLTIILVFFRHNYQMYNSTTFVEIR